jgi:hypothetical protein
MADKVKAKDAATASTVLPKGSVSAPASAPVVQSIPKGTAGVPVAKGTLVEVLGATFRAPVTGHYAASHKVNPGWPAVPANTTVHVCEGTIRVQRADGTTGEETCAVVVHVPAANGTTSQGNPEAVAKGRWYVRVYAGACLWILHKAGGAE